MSTEPERRKPKILIRFILLGESGVGKTCLVNKYIGNEFTKEYKSTLGADFFTKCIETDNYIISLQIWDTNGLERFDSLGSALSES